MPTPAERRALLFLAVLAALGVTARGLTAFRGSGNGDTGDRDGLERQIAAVDSAVAGKLGRDRAPRKATREGRGAAGRADRERIDAPPTSERPSDDPLARYEARRLAVEESNRDAASRVATEADRRAAPRRAPATGAVQGPGGESFPRPVTPATPGRGLMVDLDVAGADAIAGLPWIGAALAARIVAERTARGPFGSLAGLQRVRGIGPALAARVAPYVTFSRAALAQPDNPTARSRRGRGFRP